MPVPDPDPAAVSVIHEAVVDDVHAQLACVVTVIVPVAPLGATATRSGLTEKVQDALGWVTVKALPAIVNVAVLAALAVFRAAVNPTVPAPLPVAPLVIVTHDAPLVAVQLHPVPAATETTLLPPFTDIDALEGVIVYEQAAAA